ncbi:nucleotide pyrophosphohydrolase [Paenibacillus peoriae]|uniref:nucleotide pyrophosphohydrolase n=1 Tax=Paenibacillus peoriae TaxID=59893 RepID=UPI00096D5C73|nr:nucleotide pyrophosphohydrolase [Paenibacillus peoriae]OMF72490.1 nucleotide pyrophosphohydrolase [Paenibacillus peoriae]
MEELIEKIIAFREERDWRQFHNPKDLTISLNLEASELLELFQWKNSETAVEENYEKMKDEIADVIIYSLMLCHDLNIDVDSAIRNKIQKNADKYPIEKSYGLNKKYTDL